MKTDHEQIRAIQASMMPYPVNSFSPRGITKTLPGIRTVAEIRYADEYPNSYFDFYETPNRLDKPAPLFLYCHGGGFTWGDKAEGDPNAGENRSLAYFLPFLEVGFSVVSVNYALAPDYNYPVPIRQLEQCLTYLKEHAADYQIDMDRIVFAGSSAGAQIAGQYLNVLTDPAYATEMGLTPPIPADAAIAFVSSSGLLDCERFDKTGVPPFDQVLLGCGLAYFGTTALKGENAVLQAGVIDHLTAQFPPMFLSDGNTMTFTDQAIDMKAKADALGIPAEILLFPKEEAELRHGFELTQVPQAHEVQKASVNFLMKILSREGTRET